MNKKFKLGVVVLGAIWFAGCVPAPKPQNNMGIGTAIGGPTAGTMDMEYGHRPSNYVTSIQNYFSTKLARADEATYKYSQPKRAYKRKGFAYGGEVDWKGWMVETSISTPNRTGRYLTPKPYMVLFSGNQIVEHILGNSHKLLVKVDP